MTEPRSIDLNSDLGEAFGAYTIAPDDELFELISSANVACGFHAGDPRVMERTVANAARHGVAVGAHPGFPDLVGFGRREIAATPDQVRTDTFYQIAALDGFCRAAGVKMQHVKAHGALYNRAVKDPATAEAIAMAVRAYDPTLLFVALPGSTLAKAGEAQGLTIAREGFVDRAYNADGSLASRLLEGAVIHDAELAAERAVRLVTEGKLTAIDGTELELEVDTLCLHSDTPGAAEIARAVRRAFDAAGIVVRPMREQ